MNWLVVDGATAKGTRLLPVHTGFLASGTSCDPWRRDLTRECLTVEPLTGSSLRVALVGSGVGRGGSGA